MGDLSMMSALPSLNRSLGHVGTTSPLSGAGTNLSDILMPCISFRNALSTIDCIGIRNVSSENIRELIKYSLT